MCVSCRGGQLAAGAVQQGPAVSDLALSPHDDGKGARAVQLDSSDGTDVDDDNAMVNPAFYALRTQDHACLSSISVLSKAIFNSLEYVDLEANLRAKLQAQRDSTVVMHVKDLVWGTAMGALGAAVNGGGADGGAVASSVTGAIGLVKQILVGDMEAQLDSKLQKSFAELKAILLDNELLFTSMDANFESWRFSLESDLCFILRLYCDDPMNEISENGTGGTNKCTMAFKKIRQEFPNFKCHHRKASNWGYTMDFKQQDKWRTVLKAPLAMFANMVPATSVLSNRLKDKM